jgi:hypothetical protein
MASDIFPTQNFVESLGTTTKKWKHIYAGTIHSDDGKFSNTVTGRDQTGSATVSDNEFVTKAWVEGHGGGLQNIVEDTSPQLGGDLDLNSNSLKGNGHEISLPAYYVNIKAKEYNGTAISNFKFGSVNDRATLNIDHPTFTTDVEIHFFQNKVDIDRTVKATSFEVPGGVAVNSTTVGEPTGATIINNIVQISQANYDSAKTAGTLVATTQYIIKN